MWAAVWVGGIKCINSETNLPSPCLLVYTACNEWHAQLAEAVLLLCNVWRVTERAQPEASSTPLPADLPVSQLAVITANLAKCDCSSLQQ